MKMLSIVLYIKCQSDRELDVLCALTWKCIILFSLMYIIIYCLMYNEYVYTLIPQDGVESLNKYAKNLTNILNP